MIRKGENYICRSRWNFWPLHSGFCRWAVFSSFLRLNDSARSLYPYSEKSPDLKWWHDLAISTVDKELLESRVKVQITYLLQERNCLLDRVAQCEGSVNITESTVHRYYRLLAGWGNHFQVRRRVVYIGNEE